MPALRALAAALSLAALLLLPATSLANPTPDGPATAGPTPVTSAPVAPAAVDQTTAEAGNPFVDGWYADPDIVVYEDRYWVFPTTSRGYDEQTFMDAFSSTDLVHWTRHERVLDIADISWARRALWAPAPIERDGRYYLYFGVNDIQSDDELGGIGVAVADRPEGPYRDAIGAPLIGAFHNGAQPIDQDVFLDDDGQAYLYYGGHSHANVVKLNEDMTSLGQFEDGTTFREITPENYTEGSFMVQRDGTYYLMWSEGGWTGPDYSVSYAMSDSPTGPFERVDRVLEQDPAVARGSGHNSVVNVPGTDVWYVFYHRRPLSETDGNHRALAYDRMYFNPDGTIQPIEMLVRDNFEDDNAIGWRAWGEGGWTAADGGYTGTAPGGLSTQDTAFGDLDYAADITLATAEAEAGLAFRATQLGSGAEQFDGYHATLTADRLTLARVAGGESVELASAPVELAPGDTVRVRVTAVGADLAVHLGDQAEPLLTATDAEHAAGANGLRTTGPSGAEGALATFDNVTIDEP
ncbi:family 43 glycosylhydrolase [Streptomyces sp. 3MP-14]|uniref:Family 43 glycosylhydrolase n=1 Tax=Streptomyces mimosae TaxID=2586635 RepID=A0A5N6A207_9ACTN|nr:MULTISPECIES: glycoside hydrolase family 43 protein [Streptomyces]KAB8161926.1 family 43 glycosylhydrolase [Streptomyces mimosae]KAB8173624.1 family 43 glycosylhydrolase [Streptomyces sp. 3MP-14]